MPDSPLAGGISVGDAVLTFLGDTTDLERAWTEMEENSTASATRTVNEVLRQYDKLGVEGSAKLRAAAESAQEAFDKLSASGVASMSDLIQAEQSVIEKQIALKESLGETIPSAVLERVESLKIQYVGLTGTVEEFMAVQSASAERLEANAAAALRNNIALQEETAAINKEVAAYEREIAVLNEASAAKAKRSGGSEVGGAAAGEEGALAGGLASLGATASSLALYAGIAAVAGSLAEGVKQALSFDAAFTELTTVIQEDTPHAAEVIDMLKNQLMALPPALGNITDLTHGVYQALSAGIPAAEAVEVVAKAATFATAALTDMETSVKLITASMNAYGMTAQDVDHITSALMATIQVGVLRGPQLAESLGRVLPVAANLKVSLSDVLGAASALTSGGLSADESMTALRQVLSALEKPSSEAKKAMAELGGSFADIRAEIAQKGLGVGLADLGSKIKDNTTLTTELFGNIRALTGILGLTGPQAQKYAEDTQAITKAYNDANLAQIEFQKITESQSGSLKVIGNTISNDFTKAWEELTPVMNGSAKALYDIFVATGVLRVGIGVLVTVLYVLGIALSSVAAVVNSLRSGLYGMALAIGEVALLTHAYAGTAEEMRKRVAEQKKGMDDAAKAADGNKDSIVAMTQAYMKLISGSSELTDAQKKFQDAETKAAQATDAATTAHKKMADQLSADAIARQDAIDKAEAEAKAHEKLAKAVEKTTKAMEQYANTHQIGLAEELLKNVSAAQKFADAMHNTEQPIASQNAALINLNIQLGKLRTFMDDKRTLLQTIMGDKKDFDLDNPLQALMTEAEKAGPLIRDPFVDAFNEVLEAEQRLGVVGTATLSKYLHDTEVDVKMVRDAFTAGAATADELAVAEKRLKKAQDDLNNSFTSDRMKQFQDALVAEKAAGVQGTATLKELRDKAEDAYQALKKLADVNKGVGGGAESANALQQAELKALGTDIKLKASLGIPIPQTVIDRYKQLKTAINDVDDAYKKATTVQESFMEGLKRHVPDFTGSANLMKSEGAAALDDFAGAFGNAVQQVESGQKSMGAALEEAVAQTLEAISSQAAVYALYYAALGTAALFLDPDAAATYFLAAGEMAAVAVVAGISGAMLGSGSSSGNSSSSSGTGSSVSGASQGQVNPVNVQNVQRFGSGGLVTGRTLAMIGDSKNNPGQSATEAILPLEDPEAMGKIRAGLGGAGMTVHINGLISPDNLSKVMDQMNGMVDKGKTLKASHANKVVRKS